MKEALIQPIKYAPKNKWVLILGGRYTSYSDDFELVGHLKCDFERARLTSVVFKTNGKSVKCAVWLTTHSGVYIKAPTHFIDIKKLKVREK